MNEPAWATDIVLDDDEHATLLRECVDGRTLVTQGRAPNMVLMPVESNRWALHRIAQLRGVRTSLTGEHKP